LKNNHPVTVVPNRKGPGDLNPPGLAMSEEKLPIEKSVLKITIKPVMHLKYSDVYDLIYKTYGHSVDLHDICAREDCFCHVHAFKGEFDEYDQRNLDRFRKEGYGQGLLGLFFMDWANQGLIPEGEYLITRKGT
jgi:hypothetical protein